MTDHNHLSAQLASLAGDLDAVRLPGPAAARGRAAQRTRHQVTGGVLAAVAAVTAGVFATAEDIFTATPDPAPPANTGEPSPSTPTTAEGQLSREALMRVEDIAAEPAGGWTETSAPAPAIPCGPSLDAIDVAAQAGISFAGPNGARLSQDLVRTPAGTDPAEAFGQLRDQLVECLPDPVSGELPQLVDDLSLLEVGDEGWMTRYYVDPRDPQAQTVVVGLARHDDVLSVTVHTHPTEDSTDTVDFQTPAAAAARMCQVVFAVDCVGEPRVEARLDSPPGAGDESGGGESGQPDEQTGETGQGDESGSPDETGEVGGVTPPEDPDVEPPLLTLADNPHLRAADINPVGSYQGFGDVTPQEADPAWLASMCLDRAISPAAEAVAAGQANSTENEATVLDIAQQLPDADSALRVVTDHTILPEQCGEVPEDREQTVGEPTVVSVEGADDALVWTVRSDPLPGVESEPSFAGVGVARRANVAVVVAVTAFEDPTGGWAGYATGLLARALEQAIE